MEPPGAERHGREAEDKPAGASELNALQLFSSLPHYDDCQQNHSCPDFDDSGFRHDGYLLWAAVSDGLDGYVARRYNQRSSLGVILDPIADKGLLLSGIITLSISNWSEIDPEYGRFPAWFPVLVISRDAVILVGAMVLYLLNGKVQVKPRWPGKVATVSQMIAIGWVMLQFHFIPLFYIVIGAGFFTLVSGVVYVSDGVRQLQAEGHAHATKH
ncbi:MAG: hypothetical protein DMF37_02135 [Verrucomicrobia bacterium]|nr:MAG: hypothetical protein DMF37_02135 [Verrucomicrobiota bacterium]